MHFQMLERFFRARNKDNLLQLSREEEELTVKSRREIVNVIVDYMQQHFDNIAFNAMSMTASAAIILFPAFAYKMSTKDGTVIVVAYVDVDA